MVHKQIKRIVIKSLSSKQYVTQDVSLKSNRRQVTSGGIGSHHGVGNRSAKPRASEITLGNIWPPDLCGNWSQGGQCSISLYSTVSWESELAGEGVSDVAAVGFSVSTGQISHSHRSKSYA